MPNVICLAISRWSLLQGLVLSPERGGDWVPFAVGLLVGFEALLRPREIAHLARLLPLVPEDGGI
eukprot:3691661-Heterocapsa_arctica.AAC.1